MMGTGKEKDDAYITPEIDELVKEVIEADEDEEAEVIAEILKENHRHRTK